MSLLLACAGALTIAWGSNIVAELMPDAWAPVVANTGIACGFLVLAVVVVGVWS